jgi:putative transposase
MMNKIPPIALFRLSVLGPLASRDILERGELKRIIRGLAEKSYDIPDSKRNHLTEKTIEHWYYAWKRGGIDALVPKKRRDSGKTKLKKQYQEAILQCKTENKTRSISGIKRMLELSGISALGELSRSSIYRLLKSVGLSRCIGDTNEPIEHRSFCAKKCGDIWQGDVLHGPLVPVGKKLRKVYLVTLMDDASRLICHSEFKLGETALDIEGVLKQALLKRGLPKKFVVDHGPAYRSRTLQEICARLEIQLIYCRPFSPQGKGKIERWHGKFRKSFLNELDTQQLRDLPDLNERLWAWIEGEYHKQPHQALEGLTPMERWRQDVVHVRPLGSFADKLEEIFCHRYKRTVRKDGTISYESCFFEVPYELVGQDVFLVVDPHDKKALRIESESGDFLGAVTKLDPIANLERGRARPKSKPQDIIKTPKTFNMVELSLESYTNSLQVNIGDDDE